MIQYSKFTDTKTDPRIDIIQDPKVFVKERLTKYGNFGSDNITSYGFYREMGWQYNLRPFLKRMLYKQHGQWHEIYALGRINLKNLIGGKIDEIVEL